MSLRMDDVNQKENATKLSLQTIDYRLAKLEEMALTTAESLFTLQQLLVMGSPTQLMRQFSEQSAASGSSVGSMDGSEAETPAMISRQMSLPVPPVTKKGRGLNEERLRPFTDYSRRGKRAPFMRSITLPTTGSGEDLHSVHATRQVNQAASNFPPPTETKKSPPQGAPANIGSDLYQRRRSKALSRLRSQGLFHQPPGEGRKGKKKGGRSRVTFSEPPSEAVSPDQRRTFSADADVLGDMVSLEVDGPVHLIPSTPPMDIPRIPGLERPRPSLTPAPPAHLSANLKPDTAAAMATLNPIVTPSHIEYTSITDDIDTSAVHSSSFGSPCGSPTTPRPPYFGFDVDVDLYTKKGGQPRRPGTIRMVSDQLKSAEEAEHEVMENMIRKRMRQISLTESDSLSDIARHIANEMEVDDQEQESRGYHSDDGGEVGPSWKDEEVPLTMNKVPSEPSLSKFASSASERSNSLSPDSVPKKLATFGWPDDHESHSAESGDHINEAMC